MKCPICQKSLSPKKTVPSGAAVDIPERLAPFVPFCSLRCKMIDAKRWLGEEYTIEGIAEDSLDDESL